MLASVCVVIAVAATSTYGTPWTWTPLNYPGAMTTWAYGISGNNIVGYYEDSSYAPHPFLYNGTTWTDLHSLNATANYARGIDGSNIVGGYDGTRPETMFLYNGSTWASLRLPSEWGHIPQVYAISGNNIVGNCRE